MISKQHFPIWASYGHTSSSNLLSYGFDLLRADSEHGPILFLDLSGNLRSPGTSGNSYSDAMELVSGGIGELRTIQINDDYAFKTLVDMMKRRKLLPGRILCRIVLEKTHEIFTELQLSRSGEITLNFEHAQQ